MKRTNRVMAFDADDTLWSNEPFFREVESEFTVLLGKYGTTEQISEWLFKTEMDNMKSLGYGAKAFTISMLETALRISNRMVSGDVLARIIDLGKSLLEIPVEPMNGVVETLKLLKEKEGYDMIVVTKGDRTDQMNKFNRSGLSRYFDRIDVLSDKKETDYLHLLEELQAVPDNFIMIGNSFKSDIAPVLAIGGSAVHIPSDITWLHENMETFEHPKLKCIGCFEELVTLF